MLAIDLGTTNGAPWKKTGASAHSRAHCNGTVMSRRISKQFKMPLKRKDLYKNYKLQSKFNANNA